MMIVVHATYDIKPGYREKVIELTEPCVRNTRLEAGNISYVRQKERPILIRPLR